MSFETSDFEGFVENNATSLYAASLDDVALLRTFREHNINGVNATTEGNHALATEYYLVADALGNELSRRNQLRASSTHLEDTESRREKTGSWLGRLFRAS